MDVVLVARSVSHPVQDLLQETSVARVLAVFEHACDLVTPQGDLVALVTSAVGNGPLNIVVGEKPQEQDTGGRWPGFFCDRFPALAAGMPARLEGRWLHVGRLKVDLTDAKSWDPRPDWAALRDRGEVISQRLPLVLGFALGAAADGLLALLYPLSTPLQPPCSGTEEQAGEAAALLREGWSGDLDRLRQGVAQLAGLGRGLTPAGDDFLCGAMLWAWLAHPEPQPFCRAVVEVAAPRTTTLSAALLRAAARGECSAAWHRLMACLSRDAEDGLAAAVREVLGYGATSGADALAGFLWMALSQGTGCGPA